MDTQTVDRLIALNRDFYRTFAQAFSDTRPAERANVVPIMPYLSAHDKVLDVGCGNGRIAARLELAHIPLLYTGIDVTADLIAIAQARAAHWQSVCAQFHVADITQSAWYTPLAPAAPYDRILLLAVLHHIPSDALRCALLHDLSTLLPPNGLLIMSNWQFQECARLRRKIVPWSIVGLDERALEMGDVLLDWRRSGHGLRYCHALTEAEVQSLAARTGFDIQAQYRTDAELNLYSILRRQ